MSTAIIIAGMHRSGTSAATGALRLAGISLGAGLLEAAGDNPKGYFENERAVEIHEKLLQDLGSSWDDVRELPAGWLNSAAASEAKGSIHRLIEDQFAQQSIWAVKDPRICRFIPLWREVLSHAGIDVVALHVVRRPSEVAASIAARNGWDRRLGELLWMRHVFEAEADTRDLPRGVISYESLLRDPLASLQAAMGKLGVPLDLTVEAMSDELSGFIDSKDRHHAYDDVSVDNDRFSSLMEAAYAELAAIEQGGGDWRTLQKIGDRSRKWLEESAPYIAAVAAKAAQHRSECLAMETRNYEVKSALNAQIQWSEEAVVREQGLRAQLEAKNSVEVAGAAEMVDALQQQVSTLCDAVREVGREREAAAAERKLLQNERHQLLLQQTADMERINQVIQNSQATVERLETTNEALAASVRSERKQWIEERAQLEAQRTELVAAIQREREQWAAERALLDAERVASRNSLLARNAELEANESRLGEAVQTLTNDIHALAGKNSRLNDEILDLSLKMEAVNRSLSWRFTRPLRVAANYFRSKLGRTRSLN